MNKDFENVIVMGKSGAGKQPRVDVLIRRFGLRQLSTGDIFRTYLGLFNELEFSGDLAQFYDAEKNDFVSDQEIADTLNLAGHEDADGVLLGLKAKYFVDQGLFVPDRITNALFESAFKAMDYRGAVLDGFPRTLEQAEFLVDLVTRKGVKIDAVLLVENEDELIINRTLGRRICKTCGELYHMEFRPPPADGTCEKCGPDANIVQRSDDNIDSLKKRLEEFRTKTLPAIDYLVESGIPLYRAPGNLPNYAPEAVEASVAEVMGIEL
jgi:adenylate kinase